MRDIMRFFPCVEAAKKGKQTTYVHITFCPYFTFHILTGLDIQHGVENCSYNTHNPKIL